MSEEIQKTIDYLTSKFGSTGAELWGAIITQVQYDGWFGICKLALSLLFVIFSAFLAKWLIKKNDDGDYSEEVKIPVGVVFMIVSLTGIISLIINTSELGQNISKINNPTYWAAKEVLGK